MNERGTKFKAGGLFKRGLPLLRCSVAAVVNAPGEDE
jgi:hypothetical protein